MPINQQNALGLLQKMLGPETHFRPGQFEAIESVINKGGKQLIVQKTGWGKSIIYFIITKILRDSGKGPTLLISPLLSLMRNQILNASNIGIKAESINSSNFNEWDEITNRLQQKEIDILLVSPERLSNQRFLQQILPSMGGIGLFVVDEVHCISDWGHDFRPDYRRIKNLIQQTFVDIPVIGTTATANNRVVKDVEEQFGEDCITHRGPLARSGLKFQNIVLSSIAERLAWILDNIKNIEGSGIIYCLTRKDAYRVSEWLKHNDISSHHYWGGNINNDEGNDITEELERRLLDNNIKVLVATTALGMGFDKPDLTFVIHYQAPGSAVSYYQQVGRAGRAVDESFGILLHGSEEDDILDYFLRESFPTEEESKAVIEYLDTVEEARIGEIKRKLNLKDTRIGKALKHLEIDGYIAKNNNKYSRTAKAWEFNQSRIESIKSIRIHERERIKEYIQCTSCLMKFITEELDDPNPQECNICSKCDTDHFPIEASQENIFKALEFLNQDYQLIDPRKRWPTEIFTSTIIPFNEHIEQGRAMCILEDAGWGQDVKKCFNNKAYLSDDFLKASVYLIKEKWNPEPFPDIMTFIPGENDNIMHDFCERLSLELKINYDKDAKYILINKKDKPPMIKMENSHHKVLNGMDKWSVQAASGQSGTRLYKLNDDPPEIDKNHQNRILLIDDIVDSRWTFTILGAMLRKFGYIVYPFSLSMIKR